VTDYRLDITTEVCPLTFVKTKLLLERMQPGDTAVVRLMRGEPLENVPRSIAELGHTIVSLDPESAGSDVHVLKLQKAAA